MQLREEAGRQGGPVHSGQLFPKDSNVVYQSGSGICGLNQEKIVFLQYQLETSQYWMGLINYELFSLSTITLRSAL